VGAVYLASHKRLKRCAAVKVLVPELAEDPAFRERFIRESELAALSRGATPFLKDSDLAVMQARRRDRGARARRRWR
jgi:serine/threonine protein kinase